MPKHLVIVAGEESGDAHGATLVKTLLALDPSLKITGIGGRHLAMGGVELISDLARFGVTGSIEVLKHARVIKKAFDAIKNHLRETKPDLLLLIDYPGFNLRLAKFAKLQLNLPVIYYISPQIWAWKASRLKTVKICVDQMAVIFPFEKKLYQEANIPVSFVGHPLMHKIPANGFPASTYQTMNLPKNRPLVALLPGSRHNEISQHMPILVKTMEQLLAFNRQIHFIIPVAETLSLDAIATYITHKESVTLVKGQALQVAAYSDCVVVASGTASLECALLEKPLCIIYKTSRLTYMLAIQLIKVRYLGLCNLLANRMIAPELLQDDCNPDELAKMVRQLLTDDVLRARMVNDFKALKRSLSAEEADDRLPELVYRMLNKDAPFSGKRKMGASTIKHQPSKEPATLDG